MAGSDWERGEKDALTALLQTKSDVDNQPTQRWFVMLRGRDGIPYPMLEGVGLADDPIALYATEDAAVADAEKNMLGATYGFEVYEWP